LPNVEDLVAALTGRDEAAADAAAAALAERGEEALPAVRRLLESRDGEHRWWAVRTLAAMGSPHTDLLHEAPGDAQA